MPTRASVPQTGAAQPDERAALLAEDDLGSPAVAEVAALRAKIAEALAMWQADEITRAEHKQQRAELAPKLAAAERRMASVSRAPVVAELLAAQDVRAEWEALPFDRKRAVLSELIQVTILPGAPGRTLRPGEPVNTVNAGIRWRIGPPSWADDDDYGSYALRAAAAMAEP